MITTRHASATSSPLVFNIHLLTSGGNGIRTRGLRVMSPAIYQLIYPALVAF